MEIEPNKRIKTEGNQTGAEVYFVFLSAPCFLLPGDSGLSSPVR